MRRTPLLIILLITLLLAIMAMSGTAVAGNSASVTTTIPSTMVKDGVYSVSITVKNTGTVTWTTTGGYQIVLGSTKFPIKSSVAPGKTYTVSTTLSFATTGTKQYSCGLMKSGSWVSSPITVTIKVVEPLALVDTAPGDDAFDHPINIPITAFFNRAPSGLITSFTIKNQLTNGNVAGTLSYSSDSVIFKPSAILAPNVPYRVTIVYKTGKPGDTAKTYAWSFKTEDQSGDNAQYISDTIPAQITHDKSYSVTVKFKNTGDGGWTAASGFKLKYSNTYFPVTGSVPYGSTATFTFSINVHTPGTYNVPIQMSHNGYVFGAVKTKTIKVV
jgi:hypothetical protein